MTTQMATTPREEMLSIDGNVVCLTQQIDAKSGIDVISINPEGAVSDEFRDGLFQKTNLFAIRLGEEDAKLGATCIRTNGEIQLRTLPRERFATAQIAELVKALNAAAPMPIPNEDEESGRGRVISPNEDGDESELVGAGD